MIDKMNEHPGNDPDLKLQDAADQPEAEVTEEHYAHVFSVIQKITENLASSDKHPYVVSIDGMSGSGKSTLGELLHTNFPESNLFHMDDYFLQPHQRTQERLNEAGGNVDYERFNAEILAHIADKHGLHYRRYNCCTQKLEEPVFVPWKPLVIIEGSYSQHPYFKAAYDLRIFCKITAKEQQERILQRNGAAMLERFVNEWIPKENLYFKTFHIKEKADSLL